MLALAVTATFGGLASAGIIAATSDDLDLLNRITQLDTAGLMLLFIILLSKGKLRWEREVDAERIEKELWREAALGRLKERELHMTVAEAALRRSQG